MKRRRYFEWAENKTHLIETTKPTEKTWGYITEIDIEKEPTDNDVEQSPIVPRLRRTPDSQVIL